MQGLQDSGFPAAEIQSKGVRDLDVASLKGVDLVFLATPDQVSAEIAPLLAEAGSIVLDLSAAFRLDPTVPLMLDGIANPELADHPGILACPNCTNVGLVRVLDVLRPLAGRMDLTVTTLQAASGGGKRMLAALQGGAWEAPHALRGNVVPQCDAFLEDGSTGEERRLLLETQRLLEGADLQMSVTCVRVPVEVGHAVSLHVAPEHDLELDVVAGMLKATPGIHLMNGVDSPTPASVRGKEGVFVGRLRPDAAGRGLQMWIVVDNLLTGAASNAIAVARQLLPEA